MKTKNVKTTSSTTEYDDNNVPEGDMPKSAPDKIVTDEGLKKGTTNVESVKKNLMF